MTLVRYQNSPVRNWIDDMMKNAFTDAPMSTWHATQPAVNIVENENAYRLEFVVPGMDKSNIEVKLQKNVLTVTGKKESTEENKTEKFLRREFSYREFEQSFRIPTTVDTEKLTANFENGILKLEMPKKTDLAPETRTILID